jgi:molybdenum cofactor synthesis domain-containing protein
MSHPATDTVTAAVLVIGDEILSGRTKDRNVGYIAEFLTAIGIQMREARVVPDDEAEIVAALDALRSRYDYVFTTGGIGPTHDDITADCVAKAFGVSIGIDPRAKAMLLERYAPGDLTEARLRMARIPAGAELVENPVSKAPGFRIGNVIVMAGVPSIMQAMLDAVAPTLRGGRRMLSRTVEAGAMPEGIYGGPLGEIAKAHPGVSIGSYPSFTPDGFRNQIVVRSVDEAALGATAAAVEDALARLAADRIPA